MGMEDEADKARIDGTEAVDVEMDEAGAEVEVSEDSMDMHEDLGEDSLADQQLFVALPLSPIPQRPS